MTWGQLGYSLVVLSGGLALLAAIGLLVVRLLPRQLARWLGTGEEDL